MGAIDHLLNRACDVQRPSDSGDGAGGWAESYATVASGVRCRVRPRSAREREEAMREEATLTHYAYFRADEDVRRGDRLLVSGGPQLEVIAAPEQSDPGHHLRVGCEETQRG